MTPKQQRFVDEYLVDLNATQAAIRAGYSRKTAGSLSVELMQKPAVRAAIAAGQKERAERTQVTADQVLRELAKIGFSDIRKAVSWRANVTGMVEDEDGNERLAVTNEVCLVDSDKLDADTAAAVAEISQNASGGLKVKLYDKRAALEAMGRHLGMFVDRQEVTGPGGGPVPILVDRPPNETREQWLERRRREMEGVSTAPIAQH